MGIDGYGQGTGRTTWLPGTPARLILSDTIMRNLLNLSLKAAGVGMVGMVGMAVMAAVVVAVVVVMAAVLTRAPRMLNHYSLTYHAGYSK